MNTPKLLTPCELRDGRVLKNRIVMPPMVIWKADESAEVSDAHLSHYRQTAPGCGLVVVEATTVSPEGRLAASQLGLFADRHIPGMRGLAETIRETGAMAGIQIHHAGSRTNQKKTWGATPIDPDTVSETDIFRIIDDFTTAAQRAVEAGFELLEIHGAHGYLGSQFLSPRSNHRTDRWGGSPHNRVRFLRELVERIHAAVGERVLLSCRLGVAEDTSKAAGIEVSDGVDAARVLASAGLDVLHVSHAGSFPDPIEQPVEGGSAPDPVLQLARPVRNAVSIPVIGVGGIITADDAEAAIAGGYCDMIAAGRAMLADPGWAHKTATGEQDRIERCVRCLPRCHHFKAPTKCPARHRLGIGPPGT